MPPLLILAPEARTELFQLSVRLNQSDGWVRLRFLEHRGVKCNGGLSVGVHCGSGSGIWSGRERADAPEGCSGLTVIAVFGVHCL